MRKRYERLSNIHWAHKKFLKMRGKSIKNCSFANCFITLMGQSLYINCHMRTPTLQYLYLQKPVTMMVVICIISVLPWIGLGDFSTKGEPREAAVAISMLETGNWVLPQSYANEFAFKPPMAHWLMAAFSYPQGYVSEFTSRLPSALAFITLIGFVLVFFGKRIVSFRRHS